MKNNDDNNGNNIYAILPRAINNNTSTDTNSEVITIKNETFKYDKNKKLGEGKDGVVFKGEYKGIDVAIKIQTPTSTSGVSTPNELEVYQAFNKIDNNPPYIVSFIAADTDVITGSSYLITRYYENGSLEDALEKKKIPENKLEAFYLQWTRQIAIGFDFLHSRFPA